MKDEIQLTVDKDIQFLIREELIKFNKIFKTKGSAAILMNVNNGEILSLVSLPDFDPNQRINITDKIILIEQQKVFMNLVLFLKLLHCSRYSHERVIEPETEFKDLEKVLNVEKILSVNMIKKFHQI